MAEARPPTSQDMLAELTRQARRQTELLESIHEYMLEDTAGPWRRLRRQFDFAFWILIGIPVLLTVIGCLLAVWVFNL